MNKEIYIRDWAGKHCLVSIPDFENVAHIYVDVVSGDEILSVFYKNHTVLKFDSSSYRIRRYFDMSYCIPLERIDEFSEFNGSSYRCYLHFTGEHDE